MKKPPLRKPSSSPTVNLEELDRFAGAGEEVPSVPNDSRKSKAQKVAKTKISYPWEKPGVRVDVIKGMGVPLSEPYLLKLRFIAENTKWSQRNFCKEKLAEAIDREVEDIIRKLEE
jgi:hypothetical protein